MAVSREAHALAQHEAAYHALTAAMHSADSTGNVNALDAIGREAEQQISFIDRNHPEHRLATRSAARHSHPGVYALLVRQARMHSKMHEGSDMPGTASWRATTSDHADPLPPFTDPLPPSTGPDTR